MYSIRKWFPQRFSSVIVGYVFFGYWILLLLLLLVMVMILTSNWPIYVAGKWGLVIEGVLRFVKLQDIGCGFLGEQSLHANEIYFGKQVRSAGQTWPSDLFLFCFVLVYGGPLNFWCHKAGYLPLQATKHSICTASAWVYQAPISYNSSMLIFEWDMGRGLHGRLWFELN